jgi:cytidine deaminase
MANSLPRTPSWIDAVNRFPEGARADIDRIWDSKGFLPAETVGRIMKSSSYVEIGTLMMQLLPVAQQYAVVPVSNYQVGAVSAGMPIPGTGLCSLYLGANFEFSNVALSFTVHAEQSATTNAWNNGEVGIQALAVSAAPCGYCRQFLYELVTAKELNILLPTAPNSTTYTMNPLTYYLPDPFGPNDLGVKGGMMDPKLGKHTLKLNGNPPTNPVLLAALGAASSSYAPYLTNTLNEYAGVAVQLADGSIYAGRYGENAAYNPSISPLESALTFMNMTQPLGATRQVKRCVLVEVPTRASQYSATQAVLAAYAPGVSLEYYKATAS